MDQPPNKNKYRAQRRALNRRKEDKVLALASRLFNSRFDTKFRNQKLWSTKHNLGLARCRCLKCEEDRQFIGETKQEKKYGIFQIEE